MLEYFNKLTEEELLQFEKFIISPYFNPNKNLIRLFEYLKSQYPEITRKHISKIELSLNIYSEKKVNDVKIRKLISQFSILFERFLTQLETDRHTITGKVSLLESLRRRGFLKRFEMNFNNVYKEQSKMFSKDSRYYMNQINLENEIYYYDFSKFKLEFADCLQKKSDSIDYHFVFSKLHTFYEMLQNTVSKNLDSAPFRKGFYDKIISFIEENKILIRKKHPNIFIIYLVLLMWTTSDVKYLNNILSYLKINEKKFSQQSLSYFYNYVVAFYMHKINQGEIELRDKVFLIFKIMRNKGLFLIDNVITDTEFTNVIIVSLPLKEYSWLDGFIEEYKKYLEPQFAKDSYNLAKAKLYFHQKDFDNTFLYLKGVEFRDPNYYINSKFLLARVYYETKNISGIRYLIENLRQYIRDKKILTIEQIKIIKTFIRYVSELINLFESISGNKKSKKAIIKKELDNEKNFVATKNWFYEKISEF